jgi:glycerol kinase
LEATAFQTREIFDAMVKDSGIKLTALKADGGMIASELLMQFQADILNVPVICPQIAETTAIGAAYAAGLAVAFWKDIDELRSNWTKRREWMPAMSPGRRNELICFWQKAVARSQGWLSQTGHSDG